MVADSRREVGTHCAMDPALQKFLFIMQHCAKRCNAVGDSLSRYPTGDSGKGSHDTMFSEDMCAFVRATERWRAGDLHALFSESGGGEQCGRSGAAASERAKELVNLVNKGPGASTEILPPGEHAIIEDRPCAVGFFCCASF